MKMMVTALNWLGLVTSGFLIVSGRDGLLHFPDPFPGSSNPTAWENRIAYLWPLATPPFPIPAPILVMLMTTSLVAWVTRRTGQKGSAFPATAAILTLGTSLIPFTFIHYSLTGTGWIDTPLWYWIWLMVFGAICMVWFGTQIALARDSRLK